MAAVVGVAHLQKHHGDFVAAEDVSFTVEEGETFGGFVAASAALGIRFFR